MILSPARTLLLVLVAIPVVILMVIAMVLGVPWWLSVVVGALVVVGVVAWVVRRAPDLVLDHLGAQPADLDGVHERLAHLVEGLCLSNGFRVPDLAVIDADAPNGLVLGRSADDATLVVTRGLVEQLARIELEGVVAHLLARLRAPELGDETLAAVVVGSWLAPVPVLQHRILAAVIADHPAVLADRGAISMTRYPPGLVSALATMQRHDQSLRSLGRSTRHLWIDDPARTPDDAIDIPLAERIDVLQEL